MAFDFPTNLGPRKARPRLLSNAVEPESNGMGADQRFLQLGSRYALDVTYPPMRYENARLLIAALVRAEREETVMKWPQPGLSIGAPGARTIGANTSANATIVPVAGGAIYTALGGQFCNLLDAEGRRYLHMVTQTGNIPGNLRMGPALRIDAPAGLSVDFAAVKIQGFIQGKETGWDIDEAHIYGVSFSIKERK